MTDTSHSNEQSQGERSSLSAQVLAKIEKDGVPQTPKIMFTAAEWSMWILWALSILIGAVAFSVIIFFSMHAGFAFYEATHEGFFDFFLDIMPYTWVGVFIATALLAHHNLRHTKRGYKYQVWQVLLSSILLSFAGGIGLHMFGVGFHIDGFIAQRMPMFPAMHSIENRLWQAPLDGRMLGQYLPGFEEGMEHMMRFQDANGAVWELDIAELTPSDLELLITGKQMRIVGVPSTTAPNIFTGCGVFPWVMDHNLTLRDLRLERDHFIERMKLHHEKMLQMLEATSSLPNAGFHIACATNPAVLRIAR